MVRISVGDNGPAIPKELRAQRFRPLATSKRHGKGPGPALSRTIAERLGGHLPSALGAASRPSTWICPPVSDTAPKSAGADESRICIVEDDASVRDALALLLQLHGHATASVDTAEAPLQCAPLARPGCVLADVRLSGISGQQLPRPPAAGPGALPFVAITARGELVTARTALRAGAVDFLETPIGEGEPLEAISAALRSDGQPVERAHNREIAEAFGTGQRTVEVHRARVIEKLQVRRVADPLRLRFELDRSDTASAARAAA
jgi:FixJ family two-component response regulator